LNAELILYNSHLQALSEKYYLPASTGLEGYDYSRFMVDLKDEENMTRRFIQLLHDLPRCEDE
jgi:hypothetical protein